MPPMNILRRHEQQESPCGRPSLFALALLVILCSGCVSKKPKEDDELQRIKDQLCLTQEQLAIAIQQKELAERSRTAEVEHLNHILATLGEAHKALKTEKEKEKEKKAESSSTSFYFEFTRGPGSDIDAIPGIAQKLLIGKYFLERGHASGAKIDQRFLGAMGEIIKALLKVGVTPKSLQNFIEGIAVPAEIKKTLLEAVEPQKEKKEGEEPDLPESKEILRIFVKIPPHVAA